MRQLVLDTETTGLAVEQRHRIIEVGVIELVNRRPSGRTFHRYMNPDREIDAGAQAVHGISNERLAGEQRFEDLATALWAFLEGSELIIHNAPFDVGFLDAEFARCGVGRPLAEACTITDTVTMARRLHPGQKVNLDALCRRYNVDNSNRDLHGALLDARLLADVYLAMTGGQSDLMLEAEAGGSAGAGRFSWTRRLGAGTRPLPVRQADADELAAHRARLQAIAKKGRLVWSDDLPPAAP